MLPKIKHWVARYLPAEILATIGALSVSGIAFYLTHNLAITAYAGTVGENMAYYGTILFREIRSDYQVNHTYSIKEFLKTVRNLFVEFGPAELLDSGIIRPFFMYIMPIVTGHIAIGIFLGKILADVFFYMPTIVAYETRKKYLK